MTDRDGLVALNPFPGLRSFAADEADRFFGRGKQIAELEDRLASTPFLAVIGSSGCGKSSLVRAGLLERISAPAGEGRTSWLPVVMRPGPRPIATLARALAPTCGGSSSSEELRVGSLYGRLRMGGLGLVEAVRLAHLPKLTRILLIVDQFEEVFRFRRLMEPDEATAFVKLLLNGAADRETALSVAITMRAERIGDCAEFRDLPETINRGQYLVPKLTTAQRAETIEGPVRLRGFAVAPRLVQRVLNDVSDAFDDLPIMQHALTRTWEFWARQGGTGPIDLEHYHAIGTAKQALAQHAEQVLGSLGALVPVAERTFRAITERSADGSEGRRPMQLDQLRAVVGAGPGEVERVVERFREPGTAFLVPVDESGVVDITHEALIRRWPRLVDWSCAEAESRDMLLRVLEAADQHARGDGSLWTGRTLHRALDWCEAARPTPAWVSLHVEGGEGEVAWKTGEAFLRASADAEGKERRRRATSRVLRVFVMVAVVAILVVSGGLWLVLDLWKSRELASKALLELRRDPALAAQLAVRSMKRGSHAKAEDLLRQALAALEMAHLESLVEHDARIADAQPSGDGTLVAVASGRSVSIRELPTLSLRAKRSFGHTVQRVWWIAGDRALLVLDDEGIAHIAPINTAGGEALVATLRCTPRPPSERNFVWTAAVSADQALFALGCSDGEVRVLRASALDAPAQEFTGPMPAATVTALAFSSDRRHVAAGDADGVIRVWRVAGGTAAWLAPRPGAEAEWALRHAGAVRSVSFHPSAAGSMLTTGDDGVGVIWSLDLERRRVIDARRVAYDRPIVRAGFGPREGADRQAFLVVDKRLLLWDAPDAGSRSMRGHDNWIVDASASGDGGLFVTGSDDGTARIWYATGGSPIAVIRGHRGSVRRAFFVQGGARIVTASEDGTLRVWRYSIPRVLDATRGWTLGLAVRERGRLRPLVVVGDEKALRVLPLPGVHRSAPHAPGAIPAHGAGVDAVTFRLPREFDQVSRLSWSVDGRIIGNASTTSLHVVDARPILWDAARHGELTPGWLRAWRTAAFAPDGHELVTSGANGTAVWALSALDATGAAPRPVAAVGERMHYSAAISRDGRWIATYGADGLLLWDRNAETRRGRLLSGHAGIISAMTFGPDSKVLLTASLDGTARLWSVEGGAAKVLQAGQAGGLICGAFDTAGRRVVTGGADGNIYVWDVQTAGLIAILEWHGSDSVNEVAFGADENTILSASDDGTVKLGRCEVCALAREELAGRAAELAKLDAVGAQRLEDASKIRLRDELLPWLPTTAGR